MTNLDDLEDLLHRGEKEKAYELIKEDKGITAEILMNEGISFGIIGDYKLSISYFEFAVKISANNEIKEGARENLVVAYNNRGNAYSELKEHEKAIEDYNKALELNPKYAAAYYNRGLAYGELKDYKRSIEDYNKVIELDPNSAEAYNNRGAAYYKLKKLEKAIEDLNTAIEINPEYTPAYSNRGTAYLELKQHDKAIEDCNKAVELDPEDHEAYNIRGNVYRKLNQHEKAIDDYNKAIERNPNFAGAYNNRGLAYYELNKHERAIDDYNKAIELNPIFAMAYYNRGLAYGKLNKHEKAIDDYNKAIEYDPEDHEAYYDRGLTYLKLKQYEEAIDDCNKAIELNPEDHEAYNNRGYAYYKLNKPEEAIDDFNKAIELNPKYAGAYSNRGSVYINLRQNEKAIEDYNKAIELNPNLAEAYANRGVTLVQTNDDLDKAIDDFKHARDLFEGNGKERMPGFVEWAKARKELNLKNWDSFRERMNEAKEIFEKTNDSLSLSFAASINFSYLDEKLDNALNISDPIKALEEIEKALKNPPEVEGLTDPERTIFSARILSFAILSEFISSVRSIDENTDLRMVKTKLAELLEDSREVEDAFESVDFVKGKTAIVDIQEIISSVKQEIGKIEWAANKKQKALDILIEYWPRFGPAIKEMNGIATRETENIALGREIRRMESKMEDRFAETKGIISKGFEKCSEEILKAKKMQKKGLIQPKANIFVSYAREDIEKVRPICNHLKSMSYDVWLDEEKLLPGQEWKFEVEKAIEEADIFLACLSNNSVSKSGYVQKELKRGLEIYDEQPEGRIYLIPVRLDDCEVQRKFRELQWCNLFEENGLEKLLKAIESALQEKKNILGKVGFAETNEIILEGFKNSSEEHKAILEIIYETKNILLQKDVVKARYRIEFQAPLSSSLSPISPKIIVDIPMGNLTEEQIAEKSEEITAKLKDMSGKVKSEFFDAIKHVPETGEKLLKRLKNRKG